MSIPRTATTMAASARAQGGTPASSAQQEEAPAEPIARHGGHRRIKWNELFRFPPQKRSRKAENTFRALGRFLVTFVAPFKALVALIALCMIINQGLSVVMPLAMGQVVDHVVLRGDARLLGVIAAGLMLFVVLRSGYLYLQRILAVVLGSLLVRRVRQQLHAHLQRQALIFIESVQAGGIISRVVGDTEAVRGLLFGGFFNLFASLLRLVIVFLVLLHLHWQLTMLACIFLPFFVITYARLSLRLRPAHREIREDHARMSAGVGEVFSGAKVVKTFSKETSEDILFSARQNRIVRKSVALGRLDASLHFTAELASGLGTIVLLWYGGAEIMRGNLTVGELIAFSGLLGMMFAPMVEVVMINTQIQAALASIERIFEVLDARPEADERPDAIVPGRLKGEVCFKNVTFVYPEIKKLEGQEEADREAEPAAARPKPALHNVSFHVRPGECVALVGPSGAGKTTIINLLARFYDLQEGSITVDGIDVRRYQLRPFRRQIALVLQETFLFKGSLRDNIRYGRPQADDEEIRRAADAAGAWEFIQAMPHGLETEVGERGTQLSGGQRQRLSIARALLADPRLLVLDEATSALDSKTESQIQEALEELMKGRTTFVIAHRLSTITNADRIIVLEAGRILEMGTHDELLEKEGAYYQMFMEQYGKARLNRHTMDKVLEWREARQRGKKSRRLAAVS